MGIPNELKYDTLIIDLYISIQGSLYGILFRENIPIQNVEKGKELEL